jgi:glycolate oxidase
MEISSFVQAAREFMGEDQIITDREGMAHFCYDATEIRFMPEAVLLPISTEQVSHVMKLSYRFDVPVTPQGGRTGLSGGALPAKGGIVLSLLRMNRILEIDERNLQAVVEPGVISADLQNEVLRRGLLFPPEPSSVVESTVGGNVAENAGYTRAVKYGVTRDYVLGLEAVLPDGIVIRVGGRTVKNVAGYDLVGLLTGSEGTLAVITKITFKLLPIPRVRETCIIYLDDLVTAADLVVDIFKSGIVPCAIELMDRISINAVADYLTTELTREAEALLLVEVDGNYEEGVLEEGRKIVGVAQQFPGVREARLAAEKKEAERYWTYRRETLPALKALGRDHLEADVVVPRYSLPFLVKAVREMEIGDKIRVATYGHAGDGNLHVTIMYRKRNFDELREAHELLEEVYRKTVAMDGRLTGEHGVGLTVKDYLGLHTSAAEIGIMKRIKHAFDPKGLLNPGKIFPDSV